MKNFVAIILTLTMSLYSLPLMGAENKTAIFNTQEACETALESGDFAYYVPVSLKDKGKDPIDKKEVFPIKLEADQCRFQSTMKGWKWVVQKEGTLMRARKSADGELVIFARNDCGNADNTPISALVVAPPPPALIEMTAPAPSPVEPLRLDIKVKYDPLPTPAPANAGLVEKGKSRTWLYVLGGVLLAGGIVALAGGKKDNKSGTPPGGSTGPAF